MYSPLERFFDKKRGGGGVKNVDINKQMMKSCKSSHERYQLELAAKRKQKLEEEALSNAKKQETVKEAEKAANSKKNEEEKKEIEHDILLMKSGITIAEDSVEAGNKELDACLRSVNLDRNKLISAQSKINMGVKRKGELPYELVILKKKLKGIGQ